MRETEKEIPYTCDLVKKIIDNLDPLRSGDKTDRWYVCCALKNSGYDYEMFEYFVDKYPYPNKLCPPKILWGFVKPNIKPKITFGTIWDMLKDDMNVYSYMQFKEDNDIEYIDGKLVQIYK